MAFDSSAFMQAQTVPRTRVLSVPALAMFFGDGEAATWTVRNLTSNEVARSEAAKQRLSIEDGLLDALRSGSKAGLVKSLQEALGRGDHVEPDTARRIEILAAGSVVPECTLEMSVKIAENFPVVFYELTNAILELTGRGADLEKKVPRSGETPASEPPSD
jgi:hypothetical protein